MATTLEWKLTQIGGCCKSYDNGITSIFEQQTFDVKKMFVQYVGVLKDILKLNYGSVQTPIVIFKCEWIKQ
jgi:hypothetical protein